MGCNGNCNCNDEPVVTQIIGQRGAPGDNGWSPLFAIVPDGSREVVQIIGWTGGTGTPPSIINQYLGVTGIVTDITQAVNIKGPQGIQGIAGINGLNGWTAVMAIVSDGNRRVIQIVDWTGGSGVKPSIINQFIGATGIVSTAAAAVDIRGATGPQGPPGPSGPTLPDPVGQNGKILGVASNVYTLLSNPNPLPPIVANSRRPLREKNDGTGSEWYGPIQAHIRIPMQSNEIHPTGAGNTYVTFHNADSSIILQYTLPNDGKIRKLFFSSCLSVSSHASATDANLGLSLVHFRYVDITNSIEYAVDIIETAYRKTPSFQYYGIFTCTGQTIAHQFKNIVGQNAGGFLGGHLTILEVL